MINPEEQGRFSQIVGGATYVSHRKEDWIILEIDLPRTSNGLDELFSLQLLVVRDDLEAQLPNRHLKLRSPNLRFRAVQANLSAIVIAEDRYEIDHYAFPLQLEVNCLLNDVREQKLSGGKTAHVRGTMVSGSLRLRDPEQDRSVFNATELRGLLWPKKLNAAVDDTFHGLFLSGEQFQIEIEPGVHNPADVEAGVRQRWQFVGATRNEENNVVNGVLWKMVRPIMPPPGVEFADPTNVLDERIDAVKRVLQPMTSTSVAIEGNPAGEATILTYVERGGLHREFASPGISVVFKNGFGGVETVWKPGALFALNDGKFQFTDVDEVAYVLENGRTSVDPDPLDADLAVRWSTDGAARIAKLSDTVLSQATAISRDTSPVIWQMANCLFSQDAAESWRDQPPSWVRYQVRPAPLTPQDNVNVSERIAGLSRDFRVQATDPDDESNSWSVQGDVLRNVPQYLLDKSPTRIALVIPAKLDEEPVELQLFSAKLTVESPETNVYTEAINNSNFVPLERRVGLTTERFQPGRLRFESDPLHPVLTVTHPTARLRELKLTGLQGVTSAPRKIKSERLLSPVMKGSRIQIAAGAGIKAGEYNISDVDLSDPQFWNATLDRSWLTADVSDATGVVTSLTIESGTGTVTAYLPASRALVDPVSPASGNIVGRQIISLPAFAAEVTVDDVNFDEDVNKTYVDVDLTLPSQLNEFEDFFAEWRRVGVTDAPSIVARIVTQDRRELPRRIELAGKVELEKTAKYQLELGPTRLALPRDPSHGLIAVDLPHIEGYGPSPIFASADAPRSALLVCDVSKVSGTESSSVLALHPWSEWGPSPLEWLKTGRIRLHHRNLIQEHAEFESSFEDRFPPEGPPVDPITGKIPSPLLPFADFIRAVRDRYTEASGNVISTLQFLYLSERPGAPGGTFKLKWKGVPISGLSANATAAAVQAELRAANVADAANIFVFGDLDDTGLVVEFRGALAGQTQPTIVVDNSSLSGAAVVVLTGTEIRNWLPGAALESAAGNPIEGALSFSESATDPLPCTDMKWTERVGEQSLKIRKPDDPLSARHWLEYEVELKELSVGKLPTLAISDPTSRPTPAQRRVVNSSAPLLFTDRLIAEAVYVSLDDAKYIVVVRTAAEKAFVWRSEAPNDPIPVLGADAVTTVSAVKANNQIFVAVGRFDGTDSAVEFYEFVGGNLAPVARGGTNGVSAARPNPDYVSADGRVSHLSLSPLDFAPYFFAALSYEKPNAHKLCTVRYDGTEWVREELTRDATQPVTALCTDQGPSYGSAAETFCHAAAASADGGADYYKLPPGAAAVRKPVASLPEQFVEVTGELAVRTSNSRGEIQLADFSYDISSGATVELRWLETIIKRRIGVQIEAVSGLIVPVNGGTWDNLPPVGTAITIRIARPFGSLALGSPNVPSEPIFSLDPFPLADVTVLNGGTTLPTSLTAAFGALRISLPATPSAATVSGTVWTVIGVNNKLFLLRLVGTKLDVFDTPPLRLWGSFGAPALVQHQFPLAGGDIQTFVRNLPAAARSLAATNVRNIDRRTDRATDSPTYLIAGCDDGMTRMLRSDSALGIANDRRPVRIFDLAGPQLAVSSDVRPYQQRDDELASRVVIANAAGQVRVFETRSGEDLTSPIGIEELNIGAALAVYDNLGTVRKLEPRRVEKDKDPRQWCVERLHDTPRKATVRELRSLSTADFIVASGAATDAAGFNADDLTDVRFSCDSLKVDLHGNLDQQMFADAPFYCGVYGLFSNIVSADPKIELRHVNHWPRLCGIPFFATRLTKLKMATTTVANITLTNGSGDYKTLHSPGGWNEMMRDGVLQLQTGKDFQPGLYRIDRILSNNDIVLTEDCASGAGAGPAEGVIEYPSEMEFEAVIVNPDEVAAGLDDAERLDVKGFIRSALARNSVVRLKVDFSKRPDERGRIVIDNGKCDWLFALNRQFQQADPERGFDGRLARVVSDKPTVDERRLTFTVKNRLSATSASQALIFGRLWDLKAAGGSDSVVEVFGTGRFLRRGAEWVQSEFRFRESFKAFTAHDQTRMEVLPTPNAGVTTDRTQSDWDQGLNQSLAGDVDDPEWRAEALRFVSEVLNQRAAVIQRRTGLENSLRIGEPTVSSSVLTIRPRQQSSSPLLRYHALGLKTAGSQGSVVVMTSDVSATASRGELNLTEPVCYSIPDYQDNDNTLVRLVWRPGDTGPISSVTKLPPVLTVHAKEHKLPLGEAIRILGNSYIVLDSKKNQFSLANTLEVATINELEGANLWQAASLVISAIGESDRDPPILITEAHGLAEGDAVTLIDLNGNTVGTYHVLQRNADTFRIVTASNGNADMTASTAKWIKLPLVGGDPEYDVAVATNSLPIRITTSNPHGLITGDKVTVKDVEGNTNANGDWFVRYFGPNDFELWGSPPHVDDYTGFLWMKGDRIESITPAPDNLIQTNRTPHNLNDGDWVDLLPLYGAPPHHPLFGTARIVLKERDNTFRIVTPRAPDTDSTPDPKQVFWRSLNLIDKLLQQGNLKPMVVQCRKDHGRKHGDCVRLDGFAGTPDGDYTAFKHNGEAKEFELYRPISGNGAGDGTGGICKKDGTGSPVPVALATDTTPIRIVTSAPHRLSDGDEITIQDVEVNTNANSVLRDPSLKWRIMTVAGEDNKFDIYEPAMSLTDFGTGTWELPNAKHAVKDIPYIFPTTLISEVEHRPDFGTLVRTLGTGLKDADGKIWTVVLPDNDRTFSLAARNTTAVNYRGGAIWRPVGKLDRVEFAPSEYGAPPLKVTTQENHGLNCTDPVSSLKRILLKKLEGNTIAPVVRLRFLNMIVSDPLADPKQFRAWMETSKFNETPHQWERFEASNVVAAIYPDSLPTAGDRHKCVYYGSILDNPGGVLKTTQAQSTPITELQTASIRGSLVALTIDNDKVNCWHLEQPTVPFLNLIDTRSPEDMDAGGPIFSLANVPLHDGRLLVAASTNAAPYPIRLWRVSFESGRPQAEEYADIQPYGSGAGGPLKISLATTRSVSDRLTRDEALSRLTTGMTTAAANSNRLLLPTQDAVRLEGTQIAITSGTNAIKGLYRVIGIIGQNGVELDRPCASDAGPLANSVGDVYARTTIETISLGVERRAEKLLGLSTSTAGSVDLVSATAQFTSDHEGRTIHLTGTNAAVGGYKITKYLNSQKVQLDRPCDDGSSGLSAGVGELAAVDLFEFDVEPIVSLTGLQTATGGAGDKDVQLTVERLGMDCIGKSLHLTSGTNAPPGIYRIEGFRDPQKITLDRPCHNGATMTAGVGEVTPALVKTAEFDIPAATESFSLQGSGVGIELLTRTAERVAIQTPQRVLRVSSLKERHPEFQLPVTLNMAGANDLITFTTEITRARQIDLRFTPEDQPEERALAQLQQGIHRCFFARPNSAREGQDALILAPEGDINQPQLHAVYLRSAAANDAHATVRIESSVQPVAGPLVRIDLAAGTVGQPWFAARHDSRVLQMSGTTRRNNLQLFLESTSALTKEGFPAESLASGTMIVRGAAFDQGVPLTGLLTSASLNVLVSGTDQFNAGMQDKTLLIRGGSGFLPGAYKITQYDNPRQIQLDRDCRDTASGIADGVALVLMPLTGLRTSVFLNVLISTTDQFTAEMQDKTLLIRGGTGFLQGAYKIIQVDSPRRMRLDRDCRDAASTTSDGMALVLIPIEWNDLTTNARGFVLESASKKFTSDMIGNEIQINSGTNFVPGVYEILDVDGKGLARLHRSCTTGGEGASGAGELLSQIQAPCRFHVDDKNRPNPPQFTLVDDTHWINAVAVGQGAVAVQDLVCLETEMRVVEAARIRVQEPGIEVFSKPELRFESGDVRLALLRVDENDIPLDLNLETGAIRKVPRQDAETLQVIHRAGLGARLRYDIGEEAFLPFPANGLEEVPLLANRHWALRPIVNDGNRVQLLTEDLWLKPSVPEAASEFFFRATGLENAEFVQLERPHHNVTDTLHRWFAAFDAALSANPVVKTIVANKEWTIESAGRRYSAKRDDHDLNVFRAKSLATESLLNLFQPRELQSFVLPATSGGYSLTIKWTPTDDNGRPMPQREESVMIQADMPILKIKRLLELAIPGATFEVSDGQLKVAAVYITLYFAYRITITEAGAAKILEVKRDVLKAVENKTIPDSGTPTTDASLRDLLSKKGAAGVALLRRLDGVGVSRFRFVASPFFDHAGSESDADRLQQAFGRTQVDPLATTSTVRTTSTAAAHDEPTLDFRALRPEECRRILRIEMSGRYLPGEPGREPFRDTPCTPLRRLQYRRALPRDAEHNPIPNRFASDEHPAVRMLEATAFRQMKSLAFVPKTERRMVEDAPDPGLDGPIDPRDIDHLFLPRTFEVRYALDKPGAMFHQLIQARVGRLEQDQFQLTLEPVTDVACREPQHVRIRDRVTAKVILHEDIFVQRLTVRGGSPAGLFKLALRGYPATEAIAFDADRGRIESVLQMATGLTDKQVVVTGGSLSAGLDIVLVGVERHLLTVDNSLMTSGEAVVEFVEEIAEHELRIDGVPQPGSTFELSYPSGSPAQIPFDASNSDIQTKISNAFPLPSEKVVVLGGPLPEKPVSIVLVVSGRNKLTVDNTLMIGAKATTMRVDQLELKQLETLDFARLHFTWDEVLGEVDILQGVSELQSLNIKVEDVAEPFKLDLGGGGTTTQEFLPTVANTEIQDWLNQVSGHSIVVSGGPLPRRPVLFEYVGRLAGAIMDTDRLRATSTGANKNTVTLKQLRAGASGRNLRYVTSGLKIADTPLQLLVQFNQDLFDILPADQSVPAYKLEKNEGAKNKKSVVLPAKTFAVSRVPDLHKHQVIADPVQNVINFDNGSGSPLKIQLFPASVGNSTALNTLHVAPRHGFVNDDLASLQWLENGKNKERVGVKLSVTGDVLTFTGGDGPDLPDEIPGVRILADVDKQLLPQSGDVIEIVGHDDPLFNRDHWRVVRTPNFATTYEVYLHRDSEPKGRIQSGAIATWKVGTEIRAIKQASNESPIMIEWEGDPVTLGSDSVLEFSDTVPIHDRLGTNLRPLVLDNTHFAVTVEVQGTGFTPVNNLGGWQRIHSRVRPYVQASPARKDRLILPGGELPAQIQNESGNLRHGDYIRISKIDEDDSQHLVGDWCVLEATKPGALNVSNLKIVLVANHGLADGDYQLDLRWNAGRLDQVSVRVTGKDVSLPQDSLASLPPDGTTMLVVLPPGDLSLFRPSFSNGDSVGVNGKVKKSDGSLLDIDTVTNESPMVVTTTTDHNLGDRDQVEIYGCTGNTAANGERWFVRRVDARSFELYHRSYAGNRVNPLEVSYFRINSFGKTEADAHIPVDDVRPFTTREIDGLTVWTLRGDFDPPREFDWQTDKDRPLLQFTWAGRTQFISPNKLAVRGSFADMYPEPKQIKFLNPCLLSPKLAAVAIIPQDPPDADKLFAMQRTLLFGDSAPVTKGQGEIIFDGFRTVFRFVVKDNRESLEFGLPSLNAALSIHNADLYLVKYLITGAVVFDEVKQIRLEPA